MGVIVAPDKVGGLLPKRKLVESEVVVKPSSMVAVQVRVSSTSTVPSSNWRVA